MCEGALKQTPKPKNSTATGPRPTVLKFLDSPLIGGSVASRSQIPTFSNRPLYMHLKIHPANYTFLPED